MDRGAWWAAIHGVSKSRTRLSDFTFTFHFHALEKEMAIHFSVLAWRIPGTTEPGGLLSVGSHRVGHDLSDLAAAAAAAAAVISRNTSGICSLDSLIFQVFICFSCNCLHFLLNRWSCPPYFHQYIPEVPEISHFVLPSVCLTNFFQAKIFLGLGDPLEKEMAIHFSVLAWRIPWTEATGRLQSMGSQRVGQDWATNTKPKQIFTIYYQAIPFK